MSDRLIEELKRENLCTYFILPLLKLNKFSFISSNFVNCYITNNSSKKYLVVQVIDIQLLSRRCYIPAYLGTYTCEHGYYYLVYFIPSNWWRDLDTFLRGKYSELTDDAQSMITKWSGLTFRELDPEKGLPVTDVRLMALKREKPLKDMWERVLDYKSPQGLVHIPSYMDDNMELLSIPDETTYINLDLLTQIQEPVE